MVGTCYFGKSSLRSLAANFARLYAQNYYLLPGSRTRTCCRKCEGLGIWNAVYAADPSASPDVLNSSRAYDFHWFRWYSYEDVRRSFSSNLLADAGDILLPIIYTREDLVSLDPVQEKIFTSLRDTNWDEMSVRARPHPLYLTIQTLKIPKTKPNLQPNPNLPNLRRHPIYLSAF